MQTRKSDISCEMGPKLAHSEDRHLLYWRQLVSCILCASSAVPTPHNLTVRLRMTASLVVSTRAQCIAA